MDAYLAALGEALRVEYETIVRHGYVLQIDAPDLAMERHITFQDRPLADFVKFVERVIATINASLTNVPRDKVRLHVCWGNYQGPHDSDVPLRDILPVLKQARVGALVLPFANPRHAHEYRVLAELPPEPNRRRRRDRQRHQLRRASRGGRRPASSRWRGYSAIPRGSLPAPIAASTPRPAAARRRGCGVGEARALSDGARIASNGCSRASLA